MNMYMYMYMYKYIYMYMHTRMHTYNMNIMYLSICPYNHEYICVYVCLYVGARHTHNHRIPPLMRYSVSKSVSHRVFLAEVGLRDRECPLVTASEKVSLCETECRKIIFILVKGAWVTGLVGQCVTECLYVP